ncbi:pseudaminic acid synthase [Ideonella margarita]|uniref:Pseudaminic acid synthase n=1 Tax=Ideonella margarita TaxID=2984191 RepID=A0ABU9BZL2_9BURK
MSTNDFMIGDFPIGRHTKPFVIAEMSGNHNQSLDRALAIVDAAADCGAHGLKIQTYTPDTMTLDLAEGDFVIADKKSLWEGNTLYKLYGEAMTPWEWHAPIFERARSRGMVPFSTPFDASAVDFLETLDVPCYKIASFENTDLPLIRRVAATGKPLIISTGMASIAELDETVRAAREAGCRHLILLKCTSTYPATPANTNIATIPHLRDLFGCEVGLSDHTMGVGVSVASVALGATVVEKHFTLSRADGGVDSSFSMEPAEMQTLVTETERAWQSLGQISYGPTAAERPSLKFRRTLYITRDVQAGERFDESNLRAIRPGGGLPPKHLEQFIGRRAGRAIARGTPVSWDLLSDAADASQTN